MVRFLSRRIGGGLLTLLGVSVLIFLLVRLVPGDVVDVLTGGNLVNAPPGTARALRESLGLNDPLPVQYGEWMWGLLTGDPGTSLRSGRSIGEILGQALPITLELTVLGVILALAVGVPLGVLSAARPGRLSDYLGRVVGMIGISIPNFWLATLVLLATSTLFGWTPSTAFISPLSDPLANLGSMLVPAACVSVYLMALVMRMLRSTMLETLNEDYIRTARAKGVPTRRVITRHAMRNALIPVITVVAFEIGVLVAGTALIEVVFGLPGVSNTLVQAIFNRDYTVIQSLTIVIAAIFVTLNVVADLLAALIDPRVQLR